MNIQKKIAVNFLVGSVFQLFLSFGVSAQSTVFQDVADYPWKNSILFLQEKGVVQGYSDGVFRPDKKINRAEFTKIIMGGRFQDEVDSSSSGCFPDIPTGEWFTPYVCLAKTKGIISGYPDGTFKPEQAINQAEALKIVLLAFDQQAPEASGQWYQKYLNEADSLGMKYFALKNPGGYQITRGEMAYFTAWLMTTSSAHPDQITSLSGESPFTYIVSGTTYVVKMSAAEIKMNVLSGNNSLRPKNADKCNLSSDCVAESQAESFNGFVNRSHKELLINGAFFDAYSQPLNGMNYHQISSDIVISGEMLSMFGYKNAFGNGGMLAQFLNNEFKIYFPIRNWIQDSNRVNFGISNYPMVLTQGNVRTKDEIGIHADNDSKFWTSGRRGGLGISADGATLYYVSTVGTVEDLGKKLLEYGASEGFSLDAGASNAFSFDGKNVVSPGRNLTTVIEFYQYR